MIPPPSASHASRQVPATISPAISEAAIEITREAIIIDTHVDTIQRQVDLGQDLTAAQSGGYMDLPSMKAGNLTAAFFACCVDVNNLRRGTGKARQHQLLQATLDFCARNADKIELALTAADIRRIAAAGKRSAVITIEGAHVIEDDLASLGDLWQKGVRSIALAHFTSNGWADSSADVERNGGLSALGRRGIAEMNRLGMMVDVSHASDAAVWQALEASSAPIFASHSSARALHDHPRNLGDDLVRVVGRAGGLIGPTIFPEYIYAPFQFAMEEHAAEIVRTMPADPSVVATTPAISVVMRSFGSDMLGKYNAVVTKRLPMPPIDVFVDHLVHVAEIAGPEHVCIGTDHGAVRFDIPGLEDCSKLPALTEAMLRRGFSRQEVVGILGGNVLRYMTEVIGT